MSLTLDDWAESARPESVIMSVAKRAGDAGFTSDDLRFEGLALRNLGAPLGHLTATGQLRVVGDEPSRIRSSKGRHVRRFVIAPEGP